jgi:hypothetical protein
VHKNTVIKEPKHAPGMMIDDKGLYEVSSEGERIETLYPLPVDKYLHELEYRKVVDRCTGEEFKNAKQAAIKSNIDIELLMGYLVCVFNPTCLEYLS